MAGLRQVGGDLGRQKKESESRWSEDQESRWKQVRAGGVMRTCYCQQAVEEAIAVRNRIGVMSHTIYFCQWNAVFLQLTTYNKHGGRLIGEALAVQVEEINEVWTVRLTPTDRSEKIHFHDTHICRRWNQNCCCWGALVSVKQKQVELDWGGNKNERKGVKRVGCRYSGLNPLTITQRVNTQILSI